MYAIVEIAGQQTKVEKDQTLYVNRLENEVGSSVVFDKVLLIDDNGQVKVGKPTLQDAAVSATIISHFKGEKVLVFHKKRRKGYKKLNGHRHFLSEILICDIAEDKNSLTIPEKKAEVKTEIKAPKKTRATKAKEEVVAEKTIKTKKETTAKTTKKETVAKEEKKAPAKTTRKSTKTKKEE